jgi:hypothetical protein
MRSFALFSLLSLAAALPQGARGGDSLGATLGHGLGGAIGGISSGLLSFPLDFITSLGSGVYGAFRPARYVDGKIEIVENWADANAIVPAAQQ